MKRTQDDFVFVYKREGIYKVFGMADSKRYHDRMIELGYKHVATLSASLWIENLLNNIEL